MRKALLQLVALLVVLSLAWVVGGRFLAERWEREADRGWEALGTSMTAFAGRFPKRDLDDSARNLDEAAARLGIAMAPAAAEGRLQPSAPDAKAFDRVRADLGAWLEAQLADPSDLIQAPPEKVAAFLSSRASAIQELVSGIREGAAPVWDLDLDRLPEAPVGYLKGHRALNQVLCASALEARRQGRAAEALESMQGALRAFASLQERPEMISRLLQLDLLGTQAGTLRKLEGVPPRWYAESSESDLRKSMIVSLQAEAWMLGAMLGRAGAVSTMRHTDGRARAEPATLPARISALYEKPYARLAAADYSRALARTAAALQEQQACAFEPDALKAVDERAEQRIGRWNVTRVALPSMAGFWTAVDRARFHRELTSKVLELKAARAASPDRSWPRQVPGIESSTCPGNLWTYVVTGDGGVVLTASQSPSRPVPAVRYEGAPPSPLKSAATSARARPPS